MTPGRTALDRVLVGFAILGAWQLASLVAGSYWLATPWATLLRLVRGLTTGEYFFHGGYTVAAAAAGFMLGAVPGVLLPLALRRRPLLRKVLDPYLVAGYGLPKLALAPLFILWLGIGLEAKVALVASVVFFLVFFSTAAGVDGIDRRTLQMARVVGARDWQVARHIVLPAVVPYVFAGIRVATPYAIGGVVISELISSNRGLGYLVQLGAMNFSTPDVFGAILAITLLTGTASWAVAVVEARLMRWKSTLALTGVPSV